MDWVAHLKHRNQTTADFGQWIGLLNADGEPMMDLPPAIALTAPSSRNAPSSLELKIPCRGRTVGVVHRAVTELIAEQLGTLTPQGQLVPVVDKTRFVAIERAGVRRVYWVTHTIADGGADAPSTLTIHGVDLLKMLSRFPAISAPTTWKNSFRRFTRDWVGPEDTTVQFAKPRDLTGMQMVTVADGATLEGPAEDTIRRLISESLIAAYRVAGITSDFPIQVDPNPTGKSSPRILLRPTDGPLWEEIAQPAAAAGVQISTRMWWPQDPPIAGMSLVKPTIVVTVAQS